VYSSPAVWAGRVFFGSYNGVFYCVSGATGAIRWTVQTGGAISGHHIDVFRSPPASSSDPGQASNGQRIYVIRAHRG
jgi:outer membrane protein assembly factor BamB